MSKVKVKKQYCSRCGDKLKLFEKGVYEPCKNCCEDILKEFPNFKVQNYQGKLT